MKKFFVILVVLCFISCLLCIGVSADDLVKTVDVNDGGPSRVVPYESQYPPADFDTWYLLESREACLGTYLFSDFKESTPITLEYYSISSSLGTFTLTFDDPTVVYFSQTGGTSSDYIVIHYGDTSFNVCPRSGHIRVVLGSRSPITRNVSYFDKTTLTGIPVSAGVSQFLGFSGQVLSFITSTSAILVLVGLSIAFAIIPFAVGKVKELIKGY